MNLAKKTFAFIVHPRSIDDVYKKYPIFRFFPRFIQEIILGLLPPMIVGKIKVGDQAEGYIITIPLIPHQILNKRSLAQKKILKAIKLAEAKNVKIVGLGALVSSVTNGGESIKDKISVPITSGNSLTAIVAVESVKKMVAARNKSLSSMRVAILGATGSIGQGITFLLYENGVHDTILIGKTLEHVEELRMAVKDKYAKDADVTSDITRLREADLVIVATNAPDAFIKSEYLKIGAMIYDLTQPQNISRKVKEERADLVIVDGGIVSVPGIEFSFNLGTPEGTTFACLAETILLALEDGQAKGSFTGKVDVGDAKNIWDIFLRHNFRIASLRSFGELLKF